MVVIRTILLNSMIQQNATKCKFTPPGYPFWDGMCKRPPCSWKKRFFRGGTPRRAPPGQSKIPYFGFHRGVGSGSQTGVSGIGSAIGPILRLTAATDPTFLRCTLSILCRRPVCVDVTLGSPYLSPRGIHRYLLVFIIDQPNHPNAMLGVPTA